MADLSKQRDDWANFGFVYGRSGVARGTTTASGVITVTSGFTRQVVFAQAYDQATNTRVTATGGGPYQTLGTFYDFQPITPSGVTARFRVRQVNLSAGGTKSSMTLATSTSAVTFRWMAHGY